MNGGRFDFDDGGTYVGGWEEGKAHGHGVCTGPQGKGEYAGAWHYGFEVSGVYTWPSGNTFQGQWQNGKRHGLGIEQRGRWLYKGEWTQGYKGRYGMRQSTSSQAKYLGTWSAGFHDGYGTETYVDGGNYQGQWLRGMRHGYGIRKSTTYGAAAKFRSKSHTHASLTSLRSGRVEEEQTDDETKERLDGRGGFVLRANSAAPQKRRRSLSERSLAVKRSILSGLRIKKQHSTGDIHQRVTSNTVVGSLRSSGSTMSCTSEDSLHHRGLAPPEEEVVDDNTTEVYSGEWKNDARSGFGICERSDGLRYQGEWANNTKNGYGVTTLRDGTREEGKYKNNVLIVSARRKGVLFVRSGKLKERVEGAVEAANRAASIAQQKADIAASRTSTAEERAERAGYVATQARDDAIQARLCAKQFDPTFKQPGTETLRRQLRETHGGESFGTELSDPLSYSRHLSQTHSKQHSFEQNLSVDLTDPSAFLTPMGTAPSQIGAGPVGTASMMVPNVTVNQGNTPIMGNHVGHNQMGNHVNFQLPLHMLQGVDASGNPIQTSATLPGQMPYNPQQQQQLYTQAQMQQLQQQQLVAQQQLLAAQQAAQNMSQVAAQFPYPSDAYQPSSSNATPSQQPSSQMMNATGPMLGQQQHLIGDGPMDASMIESASHLSSHPMDLSTASIGPSTSTGEPATQAGGGQGPGGLQPNLRNQQQQSSSRFSLSDDHYDQYVITDPSGQPRIRRNRPSLMRQNDVNDPAGMLNRRSTLASSRDRKVDPAAASSESQENMGSLPNLAELETNGVRLRREEAARLASQRRQEVLRDQEEQALLRANPLRYLFHPGLRAWLLRWKVPLLLAAINLTLVYFLFKLLTYEKRTGGAGHHKKEL